MTKAGDVHVRESRVRREGAEANVEFLGLLSSSVCRIIPQSRRFLVCGRSTSNPALPRRMGERLGRQRVDEYLQWIPTSGGGLTPTKKPSIVRAKSSLGYAVKKTCQ